MSLRVEKKCTNMRRRRRRRNLWYYLALFTVFLTFVKHVKGLNNHDELRSNRQEGYLKRLNTVEEVEQEEESERGNDTNDRKVEFIIEKRDDSSDIADKAATEAKAASDAQNIAGQQAAHQIKVQLADKAIRAAKMAQADLVGKIALIQQLNEEMQEAQSVLHQGTSELEKMRTSASAAIRLARDSRKQMQILMKLVEIAKLNFKRSQISIEGAKESLKMKRILLRAAKRRCEELINHLKVAESNLVKTRQAVLKAESSARDAKAKITRLDRRYI